MAAKDFNRTLEFTPEDAFLMIRALYQSSVGMPKWREGVMSSLNRVVTEYKRELHKDLQNLDDYLDGDGILRVPKMRAAHNGESVEYRAFAKTLLGTEYLGTFESARLAKESWRDYWKTKGVEKDINDPDVISVYSYSVTGKLVIWEDLESDKIIQKNVTLSSSD